MSMVRTPVPDKRAATARLRDLTARLDQHRLIEDSRRGPREWQLLAHGGRTRHAC